MMNRPRNPRAKLDSEAGLSLLEVLCASVVLAVGVLGLAPMMVLSIESNGRSNETTMASMHAQASLERYKRLDVLPAPPYIEIVMDTTSGIQQTVNIDDNTSDGTVPLGMSRIAVTANWTDKAGVNRELKYSTLRRQ